MQRYNQSPQDATVVMLPQYREAAVRPYRPGDYTKPSSKSELRQPDRPPSLEVQLLTAGENYDRAHDFFKTQFDRTGITDAAADARGFYDDELYLEHPVLAAVGSTLAGEAFDFWREAATDPINVATAGAGSAPRAVLGSGVRSGTLHRAAKLAKAVDDAQMGKAAASEAKITEEYVKALRGLRSRQRELATERGVKLAGYEASEPLHLTAITSALEDGLGRKYDTRGIVAFPNSGPPSPDPDDYFSQAFGYDRSQPMISRGVDLTGLVGTGGPMHGVPRDAIRAVSGGEAHTLIDASGEIYGGNPAKAGAGLIDLGLGSNYGAVSPFNLEKSRGITLPDDAPGLLQRLAVFPDDEAALEAWALLQDRANAGVRAYNEGRVGGIAGARKWDSGVPWEVAGPARRGAGGMYRSGIGGGGGAAEWLARQAQEAYAGPSLIKPYKKK